MNVHAGTMAAALVASIALCAGLAAQVNTRVSGVRPDEIVARAARDAQPREVDCTPYGIEVRKEQIARMERRARFSHSGDFADWARAEARKDRHLLRLCDAELADPCFDLRRAQWQAARQRGEPVTARTPKGPALEACERGEYYRDPNAYWYED